MREEKRGRQRSELDSVVLMCRAGCITVRKNGMAQSCLQTAVEHASNFDCFLARPAGVFALCASREPEIARCGGEGVGGVDAQLRHGNQRIRLQDHNITAESIH